MRRLRANFYGKTQSGKTWLAHWWIKKYVRKEILPRIVVVDKTPDQYKKNLKPMGFEHTELTEESPENLNWHAMLKEEPYHFFELNGPTGEQVSTHMNKLAKYLGRAGNTLLVLDEAYDIWSLKEKMPRLESLVRSGAKRGLDWIFISQQPVDIAMPSRSQTSLLLTFQIDEPRHADYLAKKMGEVTQEDIQSLRNREFILYNADESTVRKGNSNKLKT